MGIASVLGYLISLLVAIAPAAVEAGYYEVNAIVSADAIEFRSRLHYKFLIGGAHLDFAYRECYSPIIILSKNGATGAWGPFCPEVQGVKNEMGLFFPDGLNTTAGITHAYDGYTETFYPCTKVDQDFERREDQWGWQTYVCGPIPMVFEDGHPRRNLPNTTPSCPNAPCGKAREYFCAALAYVAIFSIMFFLIEITRRWRREHQYTPIGE